MKYLSGIKNRDLSKEIALVRVDFNIEDEELRELLREKKVPLRIGAVIPTINFLRERGARVVLLSHRGRPLSHFSQSGREAKKETIRPFVAILSKLIGIKTDFFPFDKAFVQAPDFKMLRNKIEALPSGGVMLLGNLRFFEGEEKNDENFARSLAGLGTLYINDAFAVSHRADASVSAITSFIPSYAGLLLEDELRNLSHVMKSAKKPFIVILGGGKIHGKIELIKYFFKKADLFLVGGGIANTFFASQGLPVGNSLWDKEVDGKGFLKKYGKKIVLPEDVAIKNRAILDIGPRTVTRYREAIRRAKTIIWNGPMGYIEDDRFEKGTKELVGAIIKSKAFAVIGGGETTGVFQQESRGKNPERIFLSTGGGAMLEYLAGKKLPGIQALARN